MSFENIRLTDAQVEEASAALERKVPAHPKCIMCTEPKVGILQFLGRVEFGLNAKKADVATATLVTACTNCGNLQHYALRGLELDFDKAWDPKPYPDGERK